MLLDGSIKEHNVDGHVCVSLSLICVYIYIIIGLPLAKRFI
jgi:hypothetical protein